MIARIAELLELEVDDLLGAAGHLTQTARNPTQIPLPVRPHLTTLPLDALAPDVFEQFSADLAAKLYPDAIVHRFGAQGHRQYGIDIVVEHPAGERTGIQCKRVASFGPAKVRKAVRELTIPVRKCIIFLSRVASPDARQEIKKHPNWEIHDAVDLSRSVQQLPLDDAVRLVDTYFPGWREPFLGVAAPGPWLTGDEVFRSFGGRIYTHDWQLVGREDVISELLTLIEDSSHPIVALIGRGGLGKTRLLRALGEECEQKRTMVVRFLGQDANVRPEDFELLPQGDQLLIIIDDAHSRTDVGTLISGIYRARPGAKVLLALRPYGLTQLSANLRKIGLHPSELPTCELRDLKISDAEELARTILGAEADAGVVRQLAEIGTDCPLLIVVGAGLIKRGQLASSRLVASESMRTEILAAFQDAVVVNPSHGDPELRREVLKAVAITQPFHEAAPDFQSTISTLTGRPYDQLVPHLRSLEDAGILLRRGDHCVSSRTSLVTRFWHMPSSMTGQVLPQDMRRECMPPRPKASLCST